MKVLITGAGGFLGNQLVQDFLAFTDAEVFAMSSQRERLIRRYGSNPRFHLVPDVPNGMDVLINCAFPRNTDGEKMAQGLDYIAEIYRQASMRNVKRIINISSQSVYSSKRTQPATEETPACLESNYAVGKYAIELLTNSAFSDRPHTNLRMASLIGIGFDQRITNKFVKQVVAGSDLQIVSGKQCFGFLDVRDASRAIICIAMSEQPWDEVYNLGTQGGYTVLEIAQMVCDAAADCGIKCPDILLTESAEEKNSELNSRKFRMTFSWEAQIQLKETIKMLMEKELTEIAGGGKNVLIHFVHVVHTFQRYAA